MDKRPIDPHSLILGGLMVLLIWLAAMMGSAHGQEIPLPTNPHGVSHCDLPARAAKNGAMPCACVRFVAEVQEKWAKRCWENSRYGFMPPVPVPHHVLPPEVKECLKTTPDHCKVIANGVFFWNGELGTDFPEPPAGGSYNACQTSCRPQKCGCLDGKCKAHGETDEY